MSTPGDEGGKGFKGLGSLSGKRPPPPPPEPEPDPPPAPEKPAPPRTPTISSDRGRGLKALALVAGILVVYFGLTSWLGRDEDGDAAPEAIAGIAPPDDLAAAEAAVAEAEAALEAASNAAHVVSASAEVFADPDAASRVVAELPRWTALTVRSSEDGWHRVWFDLDGVASEGYLAAGDLAMGDARAARTAWCREDAGPRPASGEILRREGKAGRHVLTVNAGPSDALVKLRRNGATWLAFYVRAGESGQVDDIPNGEYQVMFATGEDFSRRCLEFTTGMSVSADPDPLVLALTKERVDGRTMIYHSVMEYSLTRQVGGNFEPEHLDPADFAE